MKRSMSIGEGLFKKISQKNIKVLVENVLSLSLLQAANYVLPLMTLPYLLRVLGPSKYGLVVFAQSFVEYFRLTVEFGFALSATKEVSLARDDVKKISNIFFSVILIKAILLILSLGIFLVLLFSVEKFSSETDLFLLTFALLFGVVLFPSWFFQGMEQMKYVTILNVSAKAFFTAMIFVFVNSPADYCYVPLFSALGYLTAGIVGIFMAVSKNKLVIPHISFLDIRQRFVYSSQFFASRISTTIFTNTNTFVIGLCLDPMSVAYFVAAEKIYDALIMMIKPVADSLYPYMAKHKNISLFKKVFTIVCACYTSGWVIVIIFSNLILTLLFGDQYTVSATILSILAVAGIINIPSILLGFPFLGALGHEKAANYSVIAAAILHFVLLLAFIPVLNLYIVAGLVIITQFFILSIRLYSVHKFYKSDFAY